MGKTYPKRSGSKKPKKPSTYFVGFLLALVALAGPWSFSWAAEPYQDGDSTVRLLYRFQGATEIPGTCPLEDTRHNSVGLGYGYFFAEDFSFELAGWEPVGNAGAGNLSASAGLSYYFDHLFVPLEVQYRGDLDSVGFGTGLGVDYRVGERTILRGQAGPNYLGNTDIVDNWDWSAQLSVGWLLGASRENDPSKDMHACKCVASACRGKCTTPCRCKHQKGNR